MSVALADQPGAPKTEAAGLSSAVMSIPLPRVFGRLLLLKLLARGGMGDVYLAATTGIEGAERPIVVKTVRRDHIHDGSFLARFLDEARVQSQLNHPGVAQILEASTDDNGEPYTVVEYVEGRSLADVRHRAVQIGARIGWPDAVAITMEMGQALAHVHERAGADGTPLGIVHRDLSPQNVMLGYAGEVKLIDFGTARGHNRRCHTVAGVVFAKPGYVAPEVARQQVGDGRIDTYAMGVMLWELCAGKRLLSGDAQKHLEEVASGAFEVPLLAATRGIPEELDRIIQKLCANDPDERYASAAQASSELARVLALAPAAKSGSRSVRARIASLMDTLWPTEPARSRAEFAKLLRKARALRRESDTPASERSRELAAISSDPSVLAGTSYRLGKKIGEGASGEVFEGEHVELGRRYAVKVLSAAHAAAHDAVERFRREARAIASLSHPNLVRLHDFGKSLDGRVFLVMELLDGATLDVHAEGGLGWREAARLGVQVSRALEAAHDAGLVHRDLKPQNLFLTSDGELKLLDFGVAMALADTAETEQRQRGFAVFGTPEYMAPEQVAGETVDARCDLYALGCVLYELVTGAPPFEGSPVVVMGKQLRETPEAPRARAPHARLPLEMEAVISKALAKSKEDRFESASAMREALERALVAPERQRARAKKVVSAALLGSLGILLGAGLKSGAFDDALAKAGVLAPAEITAVPVDELPAATLATYAIAEGDEGVDVTPAPAELAAVDEPSPEADAPRAPADLVDERAFEEVARAEPRPRAPAPPLPAAHTGSASGEPSGDRADDELVRVAVRAAVDDEHDDSAGEPPGLMRASARESGGADARDRLDGARAMVKERAGDPRALREWTFAAIQAHEMREARRAAEAWALYDTGPEPRLVLASVLDASGRRREARSVLEEWLSIDPDDEEAKRMLQRLGASPEPAIKRGGRARAPAAGGRADLHARDAVAGDR